MKWMKEHDVFLRVLSLIIAIFLWSYVMRVDNPDKTEEYRNVTVQLEGLSQLTDNGLVLLSGSSETISIKVSGKRDSILNMRKEYITATASVSSITEPGEYTLNYKTALDASGVTITEKSPSQIRVVVDRMTKISVPVRTSLTGELPEKCTVSDYQTSPDAVTVSGPESILQTVSAARVTYDLSGVTGSVQTTVAYTLVDSQGNEVTDSHITADTPSTLLTVNIKRNDYIPLTVNLIGSPYLSADQVRYRVEPESVQLTGAPEVIAELNQINLGSVSLQDVLQKGETTVTLPIILPNGVSGTADTPAEAKVTLILDGYDWKTFTLGTGALSGDTLLSYPEQEITMTVFGPAAALEALDPASVRLIPQYTVEELVAGENILTCRAELPDETLYICRDVQIIAGVTQEDLDTAFSGTPEE